jgi:hypothetical protein
MNAAYRFRQGMRALAAWLHPADDTLAAQHLSPALFALYRRMRRSERQHSLRVLQKLLAAGHTDPDLLAAALLHDVGKTRAPFFLPEKVLVVLVKAAAPRCYQRWGSGSADGWRRPFAVSVQHPAWGADMVAEAGGSPLTVTLVRRHADDPDGDPDAGAVCPTEIDRLLRALQAADDLN